MDVNIINKAENKLQQIRFNSQVKYKTLMDTLYKKHPDLLELENKKRLTVSDINLSKSDKASKLKEIEAEINSFLVKNNICLPVIEYVCPACKDTGYITNDGKKIRCTCLNKMIVEESMKYECFENFPCFSDFDESIFDTSIKQEILNIRDYAQKYSALFPNVKKPNLVLCGNTGTGKTFLLSCIYTELKKKGLSVIYITAGKLFDILRKYAFNEIHDIDVLINADILIIDDLGTEPIFNNITVEYMFLLFNERTRKSKPMCISTNLTPDEIKSRYTERIASRLFDKATTNILLMPGNDLRLR